MTGTFAVSKTWVSGEVLTASGLNGNENQANANLNSLLNSSNKVVADSVADADKLGISGASTVRRGKSIIATTETTTATSYSVSNLATPDRVANVVLPTDGLILISYRALVKATTTSNGRATIFIGANQLLYPFQNSAPVTTNSVEVTFHVGGTNYGWIGTTGAGLATGPGGGAGTSDASSSSNPMTLPLNTSLAGGPICVVEAAAGTYDVSVQYKNNNTGTVTAKERKLWVWTIGF